MSSKKNSNEKQKKKLASTATTAPTRIVTETHRHVTLKTTTTYQERSRLASYSSSNIWGSTPSGSQISLPPLMSTNNSLLVSSPTAYNSERFNDLFGKMDLDAKPVNLSYQSPYRNSRVYSTYSPYKPKTATFTPITTPKKPAPITTPIVPSVTIQTPSKEPPPKKLVVKKTGKLYDNNAVIPTYKTSSKNRGEVLIINNIMFSGEKERKGAEMDDQRLEDLFKQIGFKVQVKRDLKCKDMQSTIESYSKKSSLKSSDISVVVVMSHGTKHDVWGTQVFGCDEKGLLVEEILNNFTSDKCKSMQDKPKIFIFQCCRGSNEQFVQTDAAVVKPPVRPYADMLIAYSTLPGFVPNQDPRKGTLYIQRLCKVFSKHAHEYDVEELLKIVDDKLVKNLKMSSRRTSSYESRGFKRCYLHPK